MIRASCLSSQIKPLSDVSCVRCGILNTSVILFQLIAFSDIKRTCVLESDVNFE